MAIVEKTVLFGIVTLHERVLDIHERVVSPARLTEADGRVYPSGWQFDVVGNNEILPRFVDNGREVSFTAKDVEIDGIANRLVAPTKVPGVQRRYERVTNAVFP